MSPTATFIAYRRMHVLHVQIPVAYALLQPSNRANLVSMVRPHGMGQPCPPFHRSSGDPCIVRQATRVPSSKAETFVEHTYIFKVTNSIHRCKIHTYLMWHRGLFALQEMCTNTMSATLFSKCFAKSWNHLQMYSDQGLSAKYIPVFYEGAPTINE